MSKKIINHGKIPSLSRRKSINQSIKKNFSEKNIDFIQIGSLTPRFVNIYSNYIKSKQKTIYPSIRSILNDYRAEKLNKITDQEAMKEEIGEAIKKYKDMHEMLKRRRLAFNKDKYYKSFSKKNKDNLKEKKEIILDTFYSYYDNCYDNDNNNDSNNNIKPKRSKYINEKKFKNLISPYNIFIKNKKMFGEKIKNKYKNNSYFSKKKLIELLENKIKEKPKTRHGRRLKIKECWDYCHNKINAYCDNITEESMKVIVNGRRTLEKFNNSWNKYKLLQEFKYPETKKNIRNII